MSQNQEIIEAKLCAYIDDELDDAERLEIEKHLESNPQHRRLLEELRRTSSLVRGLPHEGAPSELAESFNAQLERSSLLQGIGEESESGSLRDRTGSGALALAAILILTAGLAVAVYFALPPRTHPQVVQAPSATIPDQFSRMNAERSAPNGEALDRSAIALGKRGPVVPGASPDSDAQRAKTADQMRMAGQYFNSESRLRLLAQTTAKDPQVQHMLKDAAAHALPGSDREQLVETDRNSPLLLLVRSDDVAQTSKLLDGYLKSNNISSQAVTQPENASDIAPRQIASAVDAAAEGSGSAVPTPGDRVPQLKERLAASGGGSPATAPTTNAAPGTTDEVTGNSAAKQSQVPGIDERVSKAKSQVPSPATRPQGGPAIANTPAETPAAPVAAPPEPQHKTNERVYLACRMTREQAQGLAAALSDDDAAQRVQVLELSTMLRKQLAGRERPLDGPTQSKAEKDKLVSPEVVTLATEPSTQSAENIPNSAAQPQPESLQVPRDREDAEITSLRSPSTRPITPATLPLGELGAGSNLRAFAPQIAATRPSDRTADSGDVSATSEPTAAVNAKSSTAPSGDVDVVIVLDRITPDAGAKASPTTDPSNLEPSASPATQPTAVPDTSTRPAPDDLPQ